MVGYRRRHWIGAWAKAALVLGIGRSAAAGVDPYPRRRPLPFVGPPAGRGLLLGTYSDGPSPVHARIPSEVG